jgi:transposase
MKVLPPENIRPYDQGQNMMFPPNVQDFIKDDDLCRVIDDVVELLDLSCLYRNVSKEGNKPYHPKMMLKILFYAYTNHIFSSRKIERALGENIAFIFLAAWQRPNFRTINEFRKNNKGAINDLFVQIVRLCQELNMVKLGHVSIDGSKFKANAADRQSYDQKRIDKQIKRLLEQADQTDRGEDEQYGCQNSGDELPEDVANRKKRIKKLKQIQKNLEQQDKEKINATDPDAAFMKTTAGIKTSYNAQTCVDEQCQVIIAADVTNQPNDREQLIPMIDQAQENTGGQIGIVTADAGYGNSSNLEKLESYNNIDAYIPDDTYQSRSRGKQASEFDKEHFIYNPDEDMFVCPAGKILSFWYTKHSKRDGDQHVYRCDQCQQCPHFGQCTKSPKGRSIWRRQVDKKVKAMRAKLDTPEGKQIYAKRKHIVEPVFAQIKIPMGFKRFHLRGLTKVNLEFLIVAIGHNLKKIATYCYEGGIGIKPMEMTPM